MDFNEAARNLSPNFRNVLLARLIELAVDDYPTSADVHQFSLSAAEDFADLLSDIRDEIDA